MYFKVHTPGEAEQSFSGDSTYEVSEANGVLTVDDRKGERKIIYGPTGWLRVEESTEKLTW
jgi:hypothetical protein